MNNTNRVFPISTVHFCVCARHASAFANNCACVLCSITVGDFLSFYQYSFNDHYHSLTRTARIAKGIIIKCPPLTPLLLRETLLSAMRTRRFQVNEARQSQTAASRKRYRCTWMRAALVHAYSFAHDGDEESGVHRALRITQGTVQRLEIVIFLTALVTRHRECSRHADWFSLKEREKEENRARLSFNNVTY